MRNLHTHTDTHTKHTHTDTDTHTHTLSLSVSFSDHFVISRFSTCSATKTVHAQNVTGSLLVYFDRLVQEHQNLVGLALSHCKVSLQPVTHDKGVMVQVTLLDKLPIDTYVETGVELQDAVRNLKQAADNGQVVVNVMPDRQYMSQRSLDNNGCSIDLVHICSCASPYDKTKIIGMTAGITVATLIVAVLLGIGIFFIVKKRCGKSQMSYETQMDEKPVV